MHCSIGFAFLVALAACFSFSCAAPAGETATTRPAVVVELFSSEGCSSCPAADAVLSDLAVPGAVEGIEVIPLEIHVDYWNHLGWADPFSSSAFSSRQERYARILQRDQVYTPQMIVDGSDEFVGSDAKKARDAIKRAAAVRKAAISLDIAPVAADAKTAECRISVADPASAGGKVLLAVTEDGLTTDVPRGENAGSKLHHSAVVRSLAEVASIKAGDAAPFAVKATVELKPSWRRDHLKVVVFVQDPKTGHILAAVQKSFPKGGTSRG
ncbi:MAG TPA: DUF1223 domain-containing protein [Tepidisphaeraceae bacterium]|jgi:hypothetical protein|nr:DUF1223 domain-containing protein [Tepidisphaeraceae bacterium]